MSERTRKAYLQEEEARLTQAQHAIQGVLTRYQVALTNSAGRRLQLVPRRAGAPANDFMLPSVYLDCPVFWHWEDDATWGDPNE